MDAVDAESICGGREGPKEILTSRPCAEPASWMYCAAAAVDMEREDPSPVLTLTERYMLWGWLLLLLASCLSFAFGGAAGAAGDAAADDDDDALLLCLPPFFLDLSLLDFPIVQFKMKLPRRRAR